MSRRSRGIVLAALAVAATLIAVAPADAAPSPKSQPGPRVITREKPAQSRGSPSAATTGDTTETAPGPVSMASTPTSNFEVTYDGFTPAAQSAFEAAVAIWERIIVSPLPIKVRASFTNMGSGVLGGAGPTLVFSNIDPADPALYYPQALAEAITGQDLSTDVEIGADFNSAASWYFGTDGRPPSTQVDFMSVVLHELGHGLGFASFVFYGPGACPNGPGGAKQACYPEGHLVFDKFLRNTAGTGLRAMTNAQLTTAVSTPQNVVFDGPATAKLGTPATIHTPAEYQQGSSVSHHDNSYDGSGDNLMTPSIGAGERARPRQLVLAALEDMGYQIAMPSLYQPMQPARLVDTRDTATPLGAQATRDVQVTGVAGVPSSGVDAVVLNVTAVGATAPSHFTVWPAGDPRPTASNLNFGAFHTIANAVIAKVGSGGGVSIFNNSGNAHVVVDINGWIPSGSSYTAMTPNRILDTRGGPGISATGQLDLTVVGAGVPADATAVVLNVTATEGTAPSHFTVWPAGEVRPTASNLNFVAGQSVPNLVVAKIGAGGKVSIFNNAGMAHAVVDVQGWLSAAGDVIALTPSRLLDTRQSPASPVGPGGWIELTVAGRGGVLANSVAAVVLNVTAVEATAPSHLTVWPAGQPRPLASNLNFVAGQTVPNLVVAKVGANGRVSIFNNSGSVHLVVDVMGYAL